MKQHAIEQQLNKIKKSGAIGIMTHVVIGYPSLADTIALVKTMAAAGVDFIELQIPFSDPVADGPTIMRASDTSLKNGTTVADCFRIMKRLHAEITTPLLFMGYYNTIYRYGTERFIKAARDAGCSGLIIPDIPVDEEPEEHYLKFCHTYGVYPIRVLSPASTRKRIELNAHVAQGFMYFVSRFGTTGSRSELDPQLQRYIRRIRECTTIPLAVGFGISEKKHVDALRSHADIAVIGSAILEIIAKHKTGYLPHVRSFIARLKQS